MIVRKWGQGEGGQSVTFPSGKLFLDQFLSLLLLNSQEFFRYKIAKSQGFRYSSFKVKSHSDSIRVWFGLLESFWSFQTWYSSRFSADAHRHQVYFGLSFKQVGLWFIHPLSFGSSPPLSRLWTRLLRHPAFPLVHQLFRWDLIYLLSYDLILISAMQILCWEPNRHEIQDFYFWFSSFDTGLGTTSGGKLALWAHELGGRRHCHWNCLLSSSIDWSQAWKVRYIE